MKKIGRIICRLLHHKHYWERDQKIRRCSKCHRVWHFQYK